MIRNLLLSGGVGHDFPGTSAALAALLAQEGIHSDVTEDIERGIARIAQYDMVTVNALRWRMLKDKYAGQRAAWAFEISPAAQTALASFVKGGAPLLALHTASICFDNWPGWKDLLGGAWVWDRSWHPPLGPVRAMPVGSDPIVEGLPDFDVEDEVYSDQSLKIGVEVLMSAVPEPDKPAQPLAWKHSYGSGRVFYSGLGHAVASVEQPTHAEMLRRAARWLTGELAA
jgi:hypothetical protein